MLAADLAQPYPTVLLGTTVTDAARMLADLDLPGLIVVDDRLRPLTILSGTRVLRMALPQYILDDPALARVVDEDAADVLISELGDATVADSLGDNRRELPTVPRTAHVLEMAALMVRVQCPLVAVIDGDGVLLGAVTLDGLLEAVLAQ